MLALLCVFLIFFFFQAEDGIRDHCVTGVQTCALPISSLYCDICICAIEFQQDCELLYCSKQATKVIPGGTEKFTLARYKQQQ